MLLTWYCTLNTTQHFTLALAQAGESLMPIMTMSGLQSGPTDGDDSSLTHCGLTEPRVLQETTRLHHQCKSAAFPLQGTRLKAILHGGVQEEEREKGTEESTPDDCRLCWILSLSLSLRRTLCNHISTLKISPLHFFVHLFSHLWKVYNISSLKGAVHASFWSQTITLICYYNCSVVGCSGIGGYFLLVWLWLPQAHTIISLHSTYHNLVMYWFVVGYLVKNVCVRQEGVGWGAHTGALGIFGIGLSCISFYLKWTDLEICTWILTAHFPSNFCSLRKRYVLLPLQTRHWKTTDHYCLWGSAAAEITMVCWEEVLTSGWHCFDRHISIHCWKATDEKTKDEYARRVGILWQT